MTLNWSLKQLLTEKTEDRIITLKTVQNGIAIKNMVLYRVCSLMRVDWVVLQISYKTASIY